MTKLTKPLKRKTEAVSFDGGKLRQIVVTIYPKSISFRSSGTREEYYLSIATAMRLAVFAELESKRRVSDKANRVSAL